MHRMTATVRFLLLTLLCVTVAAPPAEACVLADRLRAVQPDLTEEQIMELAHDHSSRHTIPYSLDSAAPCTGGMADIFPCDNIDLLAFIPPGEMGGGSGNDLWGWTDPLTGIEYALMGLTNGTAFVELSDPANPIYLGRLPSHNGETSSWRDVGVYENHAFIVADFVASHGMQVFDLTQLRDVANPPVTFSATTRYTEFASAHNIVMNEATGFAYVVGGNVCSGGLHIVDVRDPINPAKAGCFSGDGYTHDAQCVIYQGPDAEHQGKEICLASNEDTLTVVDVTDKSAPVMLSRTGYSGSGYVHQGWLTEDHRYFLLDDEVDELMFGHTTRSYTWNVQDLDAPKLAGFFDAAGPSIDHNQFIRGQYVYQANYTRGLRVLRLDDPATSAMTEVAFLDTVPDNDGTSFGGAWSTYPYFESGVVLISDISRGLFIVRPTLTETEVFSNGFEEGDLTSWSLEE
ncbi:MAG: choice-of-anchor B family protein [Acidobacteriota bacterium]